MNLTLVFLECARKLEYLERTFKLIAERLQPRNLLLQAKSATNSPIVQLPVVIVLEIKTFEKATVHVFHIKWIYAFFLLPELESKEAQSCPHRKKNKP